MNRAKFRWCWLPLVWTVVSCSDSLPSRPQPVVPLANILGASVDTNTFGAISVAVRADQAAQLQVTYWSDSGDTLQVSTEKSTSDALLLLPRLRPSTEYHYRVTANPSAGTGGREETGKFRSEPLPDDLAQVHFAVSGVSTDPLTMVELNGAFRGVAVVDRSGVPVWWWRSQGGPQGYARRANGNFVVNDAGYGIFEIAPDGRVVHAIDANSSPGFASLTHHEVLPTPNNTILFLAYDTRTVGDTALTGDAIWEWWPETGKLVKHLSVFDFLDPAKDVGARSTGKDWVHANSLAYGNHGNLILSLNWLSEVVSITPDYTVLEWKLGGRESDFQLATDATFQGQHNVQQLANGHILMFDNGRDRDPPLRYSRALELSLNKTTHFAERTWSFAPASQPYAPYVGSVRRLPNQNTVVHFGVATGYRDATGAIATYEVEPNGRIASTMIASQLGGVGLSYRGEPISSVAGERGTLDTVDGTCMLRTGLAVACAGQRKR